MGHAARAWAVENFDWDRLSGQAEAIFQGGPRTPALELISV